MTMTKKSLIFTVTLLFIVIAGFLVWRVQDTRAKSAKLESEILKGLTTEEIGLIIKNQADSDPQATVAMKENAGARQLFLKSMQNTLALAAQARREGLAEDANFKVNAEYKKNALLQNLYMAKLNKEQPKTFYVPEEIEAVWNNPENETLFNRDVETLKVIQKVYAESRGSEFLNSKLEGDKLEKARKNWARMKVFSDKAKADAEFIQKPEVQLRLKIIEAGILASDYLNKHWAKNIRATNAEIKTYLAAHPEFDVSKKREKAEMVLQRAKAGEDFTALAKEFSEDRSTKDKGGLYENVETEYLWAEVEKTALALEKGQIADKLIETNTGFHIVKLENKEIKKEKDGSESVKLSLRHILLQYAFAEPNSKRTDIPPPFMKADDIAKAEVEKEKYNKFVAEIIQRNPVILPEDFTVELPEGTNANFLNAQPVSPDETTK